MPTYVYKFVDSGETVEVQQGFTDDTLTELAHPQTGEVLPVKKVFTPVGVTFKGSGFFKTDNRSSSTSSSSPASSSSDGGSSSTDSSASSSGSSKSTESSSSKTSESSTKKSDSSPASTSGS